MTSKRINKNLMIAIVLFAILVPFFVTVSGASAVSRSELQTNASKYGYSANLDNLTVTLTATARGYVSADNAINRTSAKTSYPAGTYHVYTVANGAVNLSRKAGQPGSWINASDLPKAAPTPTPAPKPAPSPSSPSNSVVADHVTINGNKVTLAAATRVYANAANALNLTNPTSTYNAGTYTVYKTEGNAINITRNPGKAGGWIYAVGANVVSNNTPAPKPETKPAPTPAPATSITISGNKITVPSPVQVYMTADNAVKANNPIATFQAGTYYIYKTAGNAINISRTANSAGGWISKAGATTAKPTPAPSQPAPKPETKPAPTPNYPKVVADHVTINGDKVNLSYNTRVYNNAEDALWLRNSASTWVKGNYYLFSTSGNAINITKTPGKSGMWINATNANKIAQANPTKPAPTTNPAPVKIDSKQPTVTLSNAIAFYVNADNAAKGVSRAGTFQPGTYYVYKSVANAVNLTKVQGVPGGWINAVITESPSPVQNHNEVAPVETGDDKDFVLMLDPGHGAKVNLGVLFWEGEQNYKFSQTLTKEAQKYANVVVKNTKQNINEDPSLATRSKMGEGADLYLSLHTNAASSPSVRGAEIIGSVENPTNGFANDLVNSVSKTLDTPVRYGGLVYRDYNTGQFSSSKNNVKRDYYGVLRDNPAGEKYIIESVYHTNYTDSRNYLNRQQSLAEAFMSVIAKHFNLKLK